MELVNFLHADTDTQKLKLIKNLLGEYGQKWLGPVWLQDSKKLTNLKNEQME